MTNFFAEYITTYPYDAFLFGAFIIFLILFYIKKKKEIQFQGIIALYRTKLGTFLSKKVVSKAPRFFLYFGYFGIFLGFIGMIFIFYIIIRGGLNIFLQPEAPPTVAPVLPLIKIPGLPTLLFSFWILGIFVIAVVHEFSHALLSVAHKVRIKSSGFAFFGPIPAAFVEPDEKKLQGKSKAAQLSVFAAGPASNIVTGIIFFLIFGFILSPSLLAISDTNVVITQIQEGSPAEISGLKEGSIIQEINNLYPTPKNLSEILSGLKPNQIVTIKTKEDTFTLKTEKHPQNESKGYMGVNIVTELQPKESESVALFKSLMWTQKLFFWLFVLSIGIGLFNLLPLGPIDGGRMLFTGLTFFTKEKTAKKIFVFISFISLLFILINLSPWLIQLFEWLISLL